MDMAAKIRSLADITPESITNVPVANLSLIDVLIEHTINEMSAELRPQLAATRKTVRNEIVRRAEAMKEESIKQITTLAAALNAVADPYGVLADLMKRAETNRAAVYDVIQVWSD
jgi:hypothetical protein